MSDFYAQLEGQLVAAARRRADEGRLRRAIAGRSRRPLLLAIGAVVLALAAVVALVPVLRSALSADGERSAAPPAPAPHGTTIPLDRRGPIGPLRGVRVAVLNGTVRSGLARAVAEVLERRGATLFAVGNAADQSLARTSVAYRPGFETQARQVATLLGARDIAPATSEDRVLGGRAEIVVHVGSDRCGGSARCGPATPGVP